MLCDSIRHQFRHEEFRYVYLRGIKSFRQAAEEIKIPKKDMISFRIAYECWKKQCPVGLSRV